MRRYGIEAKYWLKVDDKVLETMPSDLFMYEKSTSGGMFNVQYHAIEFSHDPLDDISQIVDMLHSADTAVRRELKQLGYNEAGLDHIHFNIELTAEEARKVLGYMEKFTTVKIFSPQTEPFQKIEDLSKQAAMEMGDENYSPDGIIIRRGEAVCYHTGFGKITAEGLRDFYTNVDAFLKDLNDVE